MEGAAILSSFVSGTPAQLLLLQPLPPPQTPAHSFLQGGFVARARNETFFMLCLFSLSTLLRPRQRFIPGPRFSAFGAGRAQGGADGPIMDRAMLPWGLALPNPIHQEPLGARVSANEAAGRSPSGPPQLPLSRF